MVLGGSDFNGDGADDVVIGGAQVCIPGSCSDEWTEGHFGEIFVVFNQLISP